jgi:hypothetical protein
MTKMALGGCLMVVLVGLAGERAAAESLPFYRNLEASGNQTTVAEAVQNCELGEEMLQASSRNRANTYTTNDWWRAGLCVGWMQTYISTPFTACSGGALTVGQGMQVFLKWAKENPNKLGYMYTIGFAEAFTEAFPCPKK